MKKCLILLVLVSSNVLPCEFKIISLVENFTLESFHYDLKAVATILRCQEGQDEKCLKVSSDEFQEKGQEEAKRALLVEKTKICDQLAQDQGIEKLKVNEVVFESSHAASGYIRDGVIYNFLDMEVDFQNSFKCVVPGSDEDDGDLAIFSF
ncbi:MAG: hypothetical protein HOE90_02705 [Bacteriovoracaceae bacterium]|mgnify:FL=1|jgi:hypothetical protein|nr:hypothetical protein [Bacteriovoracaceae bacterium]